MSKGFASSYRIVLLASGLFVCYVGLGVRLVFLHVVDREELQESISKVRRQMTPEMARRGDILDARGGLLATSSSSRVIGVDPSVLRPQDEKLWPQLAALLGMPEANLRKILLTKYREPVAVPAPPPSAATETSNRDFAVKLAPAAAVVPEDADTELDAVADDKGRRRIQWAKLRDDVPEKIYEEVMKLGIKGVRGDHVFRRAYPNQQLAAHVVGYVNREEKAVTGIEAHMDFYLRGIDGWRVGERDGRQRELPQFLTRRIPPSHGYSVMLSIDPIVQDIVEQEVTYIATKFEPIKASIIVSDPRTGFILAMANYPTFNPNEYNKVPADEQYRMKNAAVADIYEPGSVFKIVAVASAIEEGIASTRSTFNCAQDRVTHNGRVLSLPSEDHHFRDPAVVTMAEVVSYSSNRGAAQLGMALGEHKFYQYARAFGFGSKLGFPVGGEVSGLLNPVKDWYPIDITRIPMGHSISATVLQMHQAMSVIANGGVLLRPQVIKEIRDASGEVVSRYDRSEIRRVISEDTARTVAQLLTGVASKNGTAPDAAIEGFDVAGKTGTTIKLMPETLANGTTKLAYDRKHHIASFVGFFPAGRPQVAISVIVDDADHKAPGGIAYGGKVAAPSFKRIAERLIPIRNIQPYSQPARPSLIAANPGGLR